MRIILLGPQGSGKSVQAERLSTKLNLPHIDGGQLLRNEVSRKTAIGKRIAKPMKQGQLIPSSIVNKVMAKRLAKPDCRKGFIFDGYPRELPEAKFLDSMARPDKVIVLDVPDSLAVKRIASRRVCIGCTTPLYGLPKDIRRSCGACGGKMIQREDDKPGPTKRRLQLYHKKTEPVIRYYEKLGIVKRIDASGSIGVVFKKVLQNVTQ
jgi:adenylate kinase